jgi:hypothetical protein
MITSIAGGDIGGPQKIFYASGRMAPNFSHQRGGKNRLKKNLPA